MDCRDNGVVVTEAKWPINTKIFTIWSFKRMFANSWFRSVLMMMEKEEEEKEERKKKRGRRRKGRR